MPYDYGQGGFAQNAGRAIGSSLRRQYQNFTDAASVPIDAVAGGIGRFASGLGGGLGASEDIEAAAARQNAALAPPIARPAALASRDSAHPMDTAAHDQAVGNQAPASRSPLGSAEDIRAAAARLAFQGSPEWGGDMGRFAGPGVRSAAQMEQDLRAHALINAGDEQAQSEIERAAARRGNPMEDSIRAMLMRKQYEDLQPLTDLGLRFNEKGEQLPSEPPPSLRYRVGGERGDPMKTVQPSSPLEAQTIGEYKGARAMMEAAAARQNPAQATEASLQALQGAVTRRTMEKIRAIQDDKTIPTQQKDDLIQRELETMAKITDALKVHQGSSAYYKDAMPPSVGMGNQ